MCGCLARVRTRTQLACILPEVRQAEHHEATHLLQPSRAPRGRGAHACARVRLGRGLRGALQKQREQAAAARRVRLVRVLVEGEEQARFSTVMEAMG